MDFKRGIGTLTLLFGVLSSSVYAESNLVERDMSFDEYVATLKTQAIEKGIDPEIIEQAFKNVTFKSRAVKADRSQPENKITLEQYLPKAVPNWKIKQAKQKYNKYRSELERIGKEYGVQPRFIVALWGGESNFGTYTGGFSVVSALSTMAYEGRREEFFRNELMNALTILDQGHITPEQMKGSWAGAMGQPQFMPSSFLNYAADGNGDGAKDIWTTEADVFASAANYLSQSGWNDQYTWGREVKVTKSLANELYGRKVSQAKTLSEWQALGVRNQYGNDLPMPTEDINAWLIAPDSPKGKTYLVYDNYQVLMKWNRSYYFGLAVSQLADSLK